MKYILIIVLLTYTAHCSAQNYNVALISDSLRTNANAVVRYEETKVIIKSLTKVIIKNKYAITILNEAGQRQSGYYNYYSSQVSLAHIKGTLYNATGKEVKSVKRKDIADRSDDDDISLMTDGRYKSHNFYCTQYPFTIEYEDEQERDGTLFLPTWRPIYKNCGIEKSTFIIETQANFALRYKAIAYNGSPVIQDIGDKKLYTWQLNNVTATAEEPLQPNWDDVNTKVYIGATNFEIEGIKGEMTSWASLGQFFNQLNSNRQSLPDNVKQDVHTLVDAVPDEKTKVKLLYEYLQKNTRYISIQLGIGGIQTFDAKSVATKKYGDCKALSNYMLSLCKEVNIPARYVLVNSGKGQVGMQPDFPLPSYFDHAILCVPHAKDTTWLECTSQTKSAGYMGTFTGGRAVLLMDERGGHVVHTPMYTAMHNVQHRSINATLNEQGDLVANITTKYTGEQQEEVSELINNYTEVEKKKYLNQRINLPTFEVEKFEFEQAKGTIPAVIEKLKVQATAYANVTGKRLFIVPNILNQSGTKLLDNANRKNDIQFNYAFIDTDTVRIALPANYTIESMPKNVTINNKYGNYSINFALTHNVIVVVRKNERKLGRFSKAEYNAIQLYFDDIFKADRGKIVLVKT